MSNKTVSGSTGVKTSNKPSGALTHKSAKNIKQSNREITITVRFVPPTAKQLEIVARFLNNLIKTKNIQRAKVPHSTVSSVLSPILAVSKQPVARSGAFSTGYIKGATS